jgi:hypothetical protein
MIGIKINKSDLDKFPILNKNGDSFWNPVLETVDGFMFLNIIAEQDLIDNGIEYTIGEIEIKQEETE